MSCALIIFAKEPAAGMVKTRLKSCFTNAGLLRLYKAFVKDTLAIARQVPCRKKILAFASSAAPRYLKNIGRDFVLIKQIGKDLGTRMYNAFAYAREIKSKKTVIIGTDSPTLPAGFIKKAFKELEEYDLVLGPSFDGGYYLIGMKEPCFAILKSIRWGAPDVLNGTLKNARKLCKTAVLLDEWYDVDDCCGLSRLKSYLAKEKNRDIAKYTRKVLKIF